MADGSNRASVVVSAIDWLMAVSRKLLAGILSLNEVGITAFGYRLTAFGRALANTNVFVWRL